MPHRSALPSFAACSLPLIRAIIILLEATHTEALLMIMVSSVHDHLPCFKIVWLVAWHGRRRRWQGSSPSRRDTTRPIRGGRSGRLLLLGGPRRPAPGTTCLLPRR